MVIKQLDQNDNFFHAVDEAEIDCPVCYSRLFFVEATFFCPVCGYSALDYELKGYEE